MQNNKWKISEDDRALLDQERTKAERAYIAKILATKYIGDRTLGAQEPADPGLFAGLDDPDGVAAAQAPPLPPLPDTTRFTICSNWLCIKGFSSRGTPRAISDGSSS
jgi:hypothetical protein